MIERIRFGTTKEGEEASIYILENSKGMHVQLSVFAFICYKNLLEIIKE